MPTDADVGSHPLELVIRDENNLRLATANCTIDVVAAKRGEGQALTMLIIGDSLTHASIYPQRIVEQCEKSFGPKLKLIGSHVPQAASPMLRHEGYGGWTAKRFATHFAEMARTGDYGKRGSPFLYRTGTDSPRLDFAAYCREHQRKSLPRCRLDFFWGRTTYSRSTMRKSIRVLTTS